MNAVHKATLALQGDISKEAVALRLRAARAALTPSISQQEMAARLGILKQTYGNWETGVAYPSLTGMRHFLREYRIDFNFLIHGDFSQLPFDVQEPLFAALEAEAAKRDRKSS